MPELMRPTQNEDFMTNLRIFAEFIAMLALFVVMVFVAVAAGA